MDDSYSVARFYSTYAICVPPLRGHIEWEVADPGFGDEPPILKGPPGRPRKRIIKGSHEKGSRLGARKNKCKCCGGLNHIKRVCKNIVPLESEADEVHVEEDAHVEEDDLVEEDVRILMKMMT